MRRKSRFVHRCIGVLIAAGLLIATPAQAAWDKFAIIEWHGRDQAQLAMLKALGVTAMMVMADRGDGGTPLDRETAVPRAAGLNWYVENIATDFYASYHRYTLGKPVNWRFLAAQEAYRASPSDNAALSREPSLEDPTWRAKIAARLAATVSKEKPFHPLFYSLGDETGIADLTAFWDFDLSPYSLAGFRDWLRGQYPSLAALNTEWGTHYAVWSAVQPETTKAAMRRGDDNFAAWNDFKAWMDSSYARALRFGTDAVHGTDSAALAGIEGVQIPAWGGFDYTKLASAVDVMEMWDDGTNTAMLNSFNPRLIRLYTSFGASAEDLHGLWHNVLCGAKGLILWDEDHSIVRNDASPGPRAQAYRPIFSALRGEIGRVLLAATPVTDSVAVLYSPASFRIRWMLDHRPLGDAWMQRSSEAELEDNAWRVALRGYAAALQRMGLHPRYISPEQLAYGPPPETALILPHAIALSPAESGAIRAFSARGGQVIADTPAGQFDGHGRRLASATVEASIVAPDDLPKALHLAAAFPVQAPAKDIDTFLYQYHGHPLLALQRHTATVGSEMVEVDLHGADARDVASGKDYGPARHLSLTIDGVTPIILKMQR
jgi:hypothetical protein